MGMTWTEEQKKVIDLRDRNILVSAAAGSGKTAVLVQRILGRIQDKDDPVDVDRLLIMTFTRAAAGEMKERLSAALEKAIYEDPGNEHLQKQMNLIHTAQITTIDGFCAYVIRNYFHTIGLDPGFRTAEEGELKLLREDVMKELLEEAYEKKEEKFLRLVECYAPGKTDDSLKELILQVYEASMSHPFPEEWLWRCLKEYQIDSLEELMKAEWMSLFWKNLNENLREAEQLTLKAKQICQKPGGPFHYEEALDQDLIMIRKQQEAVKKCEYQESRDAFGNMKFAALSRKKAPEVGPSEKELVKEIRSKVKDVLTECRDKYLYLAQEELLDSLKLCRVPLESLVKLVQEFHRRFSDRKREKNILDFTDMEHFALEILVKKEGEKLTPTQAARELSEKYEEVMIDEYQDSNLVQEMITTMVSGWSKNKKNVFMVGDVKQSIYRFRLARPELFMEKYHSYSKEDSIQQRVDLHKNFRSRHQVLDSVNYIFRRIMGADVGGIVYDDGSALYPGREFPKGEEEDFYKTEILLVEKDSQELLEEQDSQTAQELEALAIAGEIKKIVGGQKVLDKETGEYRPAGYGDIVILLRSAYGWAETFREVLSSRGIPVYTSSRTGYFSAQEVVTLLNYLRVCDNPLQDIPLTGVLYSPIVGCTAEELAVLRQKYPEGLIYESICSFVEKEEEKTGISHSHVENQLEEQLYKKLARFLDGLQTLRNMAEYTPIHQIILYILKDTGYEAYVRALPGGNQRGANLRMLVEKAMDYEKTSYRGLFNFVRYIENLQKYQVDFGEVNVMDSAGSAVQIMTIHKSKGLEFPIVFAAGMGKQFNFQDLNRRFLIHPEYGFGTDVILPEKRLMVSMPQKRVLREVLKRESLGEELRVLYVALTRAKEKLYITGTASDIDERILISLKEEWQSEEILLPLWDRTKARCFWDYILPALGGHPAMGELCRECSLSEGFAQCSEGADTGFVIRKITASDLIQDEIMDMTDFQIREKVLKNWDADRIYDETFRNALEERFEFQYPYGWLKEMPVKVSVSELKKRSWQDEQEKEEVIFAEPDIIPLVPRFAEGKETKYQGAARGTAYHRVMECLDYEKTEDFREIQNQIRDMEEQKKLDSQEAACIYIKDIQRFVNSRLGQRMKQAAQEGKLFREQPFVMSVDAGQLNEQWTGGETVLVQGIIDAYFIENQEIVLVDYKTDRVSEGDEKKLTELYHTQLEDYAQALERLTGKKVKETYIYSFALGKEIRLQ